MNSWNFRPDIGLSNIKAKLPEKLNIKIAGQIDLLMNGWTTEITQGNDNGQ